MNTQIGLRADATEPASHDGALDWLRLLDEIYALTEAEGFDAVASLTDAPSWPEHWHTLVGHWATRIGARAIQLADPGRAPSPLRQHRLHAQPPVHRVDWPAISAQSLSADGFSATQAREFHALCVHLYAALALKASLDAVQTSLAGLYRVIDALPLRIALLDEHLNVVLLNRPLNEWLARTDRLALHARRLCLPAQPAALDHALRTWAADPFTPHQHLQLNGLDIQLKKLACANTAGDEPLGPRISVLLLIHERSEPGRLRDITTPPAPLARHMQNQYALTDKELPLAWNLAEGMSLKHYAGLSGRSIETTRAQLKSVFRKLGISDQKNIGVVLFDALHAVALQTMGEHLAAVVAEHSVVSVAVPRP